MNILPSISRGGGPPKAVEGYEGVRQAVIVGLANPTTMLRMVPLPIATR